MFLSRVCVLGEGGVILMGRWSEVSAVMAFQFACWSRDGRLSRRVLQVAVMFAAVGRRVGESVLIIEFVVFSKSEMRSLR